MAGGRETTWPGPDRGLLVVEHEHPVAVEDHEDLLLERVAVLRGRLPAGLDDDMLKAGVDRPRCAAHQPAGAMPRACALRRIPSTSSTLTIDAGRGPGCSGSSGAPSWPSRTNWIGCAVDRAVDAVDRPRADDRHPQAGEAGALVVPRGPNASTSSGSVACRVWAPELAP